MFAFAPLLLAASLTATLPPYRPRRQVSGTIRNVGFGLGGVLGEWEHAFRRVQPGVQFEDRLKTSDAAIPALVSGISDLGPDGGEPSLTEALAFYETYGYDVTPVVVASGAYDVEGHSNGIVVYVNERNPLTRLTLAQLDGIFGEQRTGALDGFKWNVAGARGPGSDIRTWAQLGIGGAWAAQPIQTYGYAPTGTARFFQLRVLHNSDKWNPNYREYVDTGSKMIGADDPQQHGGLAHMLRDELAHDPYGVAWAVAPAAHGIPGIKAIALARDERGPYVMPSRASFADRSYPLVRNIYIYVNRAPQHAVEPRLAEFLRFILSRDGQAIVERDAGYLPLTPEIVERQLSQLE